MKKHDEAEIKELLEKQREYQTELRERNRQEIIRRLGEVQKRRTFS